jgi:Secretion system C-terminal sorting domain
MKPGILSNLIIFLLLQSTTLFAQVALDTTYTFNGGIPQYARRIFATSQNNLLLQSTVEGNWHNAVITLLNTQGDTLRTTRMGNDSVQFLIYDMKLAADGNYILCGDYQSQHDSTGMQSFLMKMDSTATILWFNEFGHNDLSSPPWNPSSFKDQAEILTELTNGKIAVAGSSKYYIDANNNYSPTPFWSSYLAIFDGTTGTKLQERTVSYLIDTNPNFAISNIHLESIGNRLFYLGRYFDGFNSDTILYVFDENADTVFTLANLPSQCHHLEKTISGYLMLFSPGNITKADIDGNLLWTHAYAGTGWVHDFIEANDSTYYITTGNASIPVFHNADYNSISGDVHLYQTDSTGILLNQYTYFNNTTLSGQIAALPNHQLAIAGRKNSESWVFIANMNATGSQELEDQFTNSPVHLYPNPSRNGLFRILHELPLSEDGQLEIYTNMGQLIHQQALSPGQAEINLSLTDQPSGMYLLIIRNDRQYTTGKLLIDPE